MMKRMQNNVTLTSICSSTLNSCRSSYSIYIVFLEDVIMKTTYFKTHAEAETVYLDYIDKEYSNRFQDAFSISRIKIVEFKCGFAIQFGDYGPYMQHVS